jgi:hypothetical protein
MRTHVNSLHLILLLASLGAALPAALAAQDDDPHPRRPHPRAHCGDGCGGLREVSDHAGRSRRSGFWFGAGVGAGAETFDARDGLGWSDGKGGGTGYLKLGGTVTPSLLLGAEAQVWAASYYTNPNYDRALGSLQGIAQFYPAPQSGFWLKGGLGWALDNLRTYTTSGVIIDRDLHGTAWSLGLGYDVPVGRSVSITPSLDLLGEDFRTHRERVLSFGIGITLP